jgi:predicted ATPase with chaperone activity
MNSPPPLTAEQIEQAKAITVNLAATDVRKGGAALDLAIAVGVFGAIARGR